MERTNPMLLIDFYKAVHAEMLPKGITKSVSYFTPRMSRVKRWNEVVHFGLQGFIKTYLIDYFYEEFFGKPFEAVIGEYRRIMDATLGAQAYKIEKVEKLHKLGYLPIEIVSLPEGTKVPMQVPMFGITNTHPEFAWLPQALESLISAESWHPMLAATVGYADYFFNGESIQNSLHKGFLEFLDLPAFRTEFMGHNIGVPSQMLFYEREGSNVGIEKFTSLSLIHDVLPHTSRPEHLDYISCFWNELTAFDAGRAKWMPYWFEDRPVKVETEKAYCSLYEKDGKYLLALTSFNEDVNEVEVTFDGEVTVDYDVFGQNAAIADGNKLTVKMEAYRPNLIRLTKK